MQSISLASVRLSARPTSDSDARRIAIIATDEFLKANGAEYVHQAYFFEQTIYQSAKRLQLTCDAHDEEIRINQLQFELKRRRIPHNEINPLKLISEALTREEYRGEYIDIKPAGGSSGEKPERIHNRGNTRQISRNKQVETLSTKDSRRVAVHKAR